MTATHLFIAFAALQVLDMATTLYVLRKKAGREGNPVIAKLMEIFGPEFGLLFPKAAIMVFIWAFRDHYVLWHWLAMIGVYVLIVGNNLKFVLKAKKK